MAETVEIFVEIWHETDAAYLVSDDGEIELGWIPKSQISNDYQILKRDGMQWLKGDIPVWLAEKLEII